MADAPVGPVRRDNKPAGAPACQPLPPELFARDLVEASATQPLWGRIMRSGLWSVAAVALALAGCGSTTEQRSATGAGSGLVGGPVGAAVGGVAGGAGGSALDEGVDKKAGEALDRNRDTGVSGSSTAAGRLTMDEVRARLQRDGYSNVRNLRRDGDIYRATATRNGQSYNIDIDPQSG